MRVATGDSVPKEANMETVHANGTIQNTCTCEEWNETTGEWVPTQECYGDCWEHEQYGFQLATETLFDSPNFTGTWKIEGFPVWNGTVSGIFDATDHKKLLSSITPDRTAWILRYEIIGETLTGVLSHHDAPMGGRITVTMIKEEE